MAITSHQFTPSRNMTLPGLRGGHSSQSRPSSCIDSECLSKRISKFCLTGNVKCLKLPATVLGNTIIIQRVPYKSFVDLQNLLEQRKLDDIRNWRLEYCSIRGQNTHHASGTLRIKKPSARHEIFKQFTSRLLNEMWLDDTFVPKGLRGSQNLIADAGSPDLLLVTPGGQKCVYQPDASLILPGADFPFLVLEIANSETTAHAVAKAKRYIRYSGGQVCFVVILSITTQRVTSAPFFPNLSSTNTRADSDQTNLPESSVNTDSPPVENILDVDSDAKENNPLPPTLSRTTSSLSDLSSSPGSLIVDGVKFGESPNIVPDPSLHSEILPCVRAWVFKQGRKSVSGSNNKQSFKLAALPVLEDVEVYPNRENRPTHFPIKWAEISDYKHETPDASFQVNFEWIASMAEYHTVNDQNSIHRKRSKLSPESETTSASSMKSGSSFSSASSEDGSLYSEVIINRSG